MKYEPLLALGTNIRVLAGPVAGSGYWWYRVQLEDGMSLRGGTTTGWVAAADHDGEPWIDWFEVDTDPVPEPYEPDLPVPVLEALGSEDYVDAFGNPSTRFHLSVANWADYPAELFAAEPDLEPCGLSEGASRTWVDVVDADIDDRIYGFCGLEEPQDLTGIWFAVPQGTAPPSRVYVMLWDRLYDRYAESNLVTPRSWPIHSPAPGG